MTPQNGGYMVAGYIAAGIVYVGYTLILLRRRREIARRWRAMPVPAPRDVVPPPPDAAA